MNPGSTVSSVRLQRADLILGMSKRARSVEDIAATCEAVKEAVELADSHAEFDVLEAAQRIIRTKMDAWTSEKAVDMQRWQKS